VRHSAALSVASIIVVVCVGGGAASAARVETAGPDPAQLELALKKFASRHPTYPGVALAVEAPGLSWLGAAGFASLSSRTSLDPRATFRIASVTKTFTAAAMLRLVEDGRVGLDDPIAQHLKPSTVALLRKGGYAVDTMNVRHLLTHTSGLYDYAEDPAFQEFVLTHGRHHWTRSEQIRFAMTHGKPYAAPGKAFHYSDTGYILLGEMLERVTGRGPAAAYRSLLRFNRLKLDETYLETLEPKPASAKPRAHQYYEKIDSTGFDPSFDLYGGGGIVSTVDDLTRFYRALLGGKVFEKAATLRTMLGKPNPRSVNDAGMGIFSVQVGGQNCWGHSGFWGTTVVHCPRASVTIALAVNQAQNFDLPSQQFVGNVLRLVTR
jgi:D-alanyl-D-alanine carboxypeptidase